MTFWKQRAAQEALQDDAMLDSSIDVVSPEEDVEAALLEVENDTQEIENHDIVAEYQDEDAQETEERLESLDAEEGEEDISEDRVELIAAAQESIRRRHGITGHLSVARECLSSSKPRRVVARESLWEDIKAFFRKIKDWFIEKMGMLKDRWIKFSNAGKTIQAKAKKFDAVIAKLGQKDKDTIKGGFIALLTVNGEFKHTAVAEAFISGADKMIDRSAEIADFVKQVENLLKEASDGTESSKPVNRLEQLAAAEIRIKASNAASSQAIKEENKGENKRCYFGDNYVYDTSDGAFTFEQKENAEVPSDVATPTISELRTINTLYNKVGVKLEKSIQDWRKREQANEKVISTLKKLESEVDKVEANEKANVQAISNIRQIISTIRTANSALDRIYAHNTKCATKGLNGYIVAGIGAYKKSKS